MNCYPKSLLFVVFIVELLIILGSFSAAFIRFHSGISGSSLCESCTEQTVYKNAESCTAQSHEDGVDCFIAVPYTSDQVENDMLRAEEEAINSVRQDGPLTGSLVICAPSSYADHVLPEMVLRYHGDHPGVFITVKTSDYVDDTTQRLARGEIDFLVKLDEGSLDPDFITIMSKPEPLVFVTYPGNPLLGKGELSIKEAVCDQFITSTRDIGYSVMLEKDLLRQGVELEPVMDIGSVEAIVRILRGGFGVALLPEYVVSSFVENGELSKLNINDFSIRMNSYYLCSKDRWINPVMKEFIRMLQQ